MHALLPQPHGPLHRQIYLMRAYLLPLPMAVSDRVRLQLLVSLDFSETQGLVHQCCSFYVGISQIDFQKICIHSLATPPTSILMSLVA